MQPQTKTGLIMQHVPETIQWGIIGCGDVCEVKSGPAFNKVPHSSLVAVMRRDENKAREYARRHGVPKFYHEADALINDPEVNAIYIATPPSLHEDYAIRAMKAGKPVYIEKPVALNSESCERMIEASVRYGVKATVAHYRRALPLFQKVKDLVHNGTAGNVLFIRLSIFQSPPADTKGNWRLDPTISGGGLFHDLSPHQLDIMQWIFGPSPRFVGRSFNHQGFYAAPDLTTLEAVYRDNIVFQGIWAFNLKLTEPVDLCEITGDQAQLKFSFFNPAPLTLTAHGRQEQFSFEQPAHIQQPMIERVVKFFRGEADNPCSLEEALATMRMMDKTVVKDKAPLTRALSNE